MSLKRLIEILESDLKATPIRIAAYAEFPFAIFRYIPKEEWEIRREIRLLGTRVRESGKTVHFWSMADFIKLSLDAEEAMEDIIELEKEEDFSIAQEQVTTYLTDPDFTPVDKLIAEKYEGLDPTKDIVFLWRLGALAPRYLRISGLIERLHSMGVRLVPTVVFYPGEWRGTLNFMNLRSENEPMGSYRVKIYGREA